MSTNGTASAPPSSQPPPPSSSPVSLPPSSAPPSSTPAPSSSPPPASSAKPSSDTPTPVATSTFVASSAPPSTQVVTKVVTPTPSVPGESAAPQTVVVTSVVSNSQNSQPTSAHPASSSATGTAAAGLQAPNSQKSTQGLSTGGKTAIAVVVPIFVVAALVLAGVLLWRKRKSRKNEEEARRKEVEEYGFNPNNDPTLPAVGMASEMTEDQSGYRGWGNTTTSSNRKASTTLGSGMAYSDSNSNPGGYQSPGSPTQGNASDSHSNDPLMAGRRETLDSEGISALGAGPSANQNQAGVHRGPSNASSSYSAANHSDNSGEYPLPNNHPQDYYENNNYYQANPYGAGDAQPVIRDVSARRNTRIENPSVFPQQGNSGIAQNF